MRVVWQPLLNRPDKIAFQAPIEEIVEDILILGNQVGFDLEAKKLGICFLIKNCRKTMIAFHDRLKM